MRTNQTNIAKELREIKHLLKQVISILLTDGSIVLDLPEDVIKRGKHALQTSYIG